MHTFRLLIIFFGLVSITLHLWIWSEFGGASILSAERWESLSAESRCYVVLPVLIYLFEVIVAIKPWPLRILKPVAAIVHSPLAFFLLILLMQSLSDITMLLMSAAFIAPYYFNPILFLLYIGRLNHDARAALPQT